MRTTMPDHGRHDDHRWRFFAHWKTHRASGRGGKSPVAVRRIAHRTVETIGLRSGPGAGMADHPLPTAD